MKVVLEAGLLK